MSADEVRALLREKIHASGSQTAFSRESGVSQECLSNFLSGREKAGPSILNALGLKLIYDYQPLERQS